MAIFVSNYWSFTNRVMIVTIISIILSIVLSETINKKILSKLDYSKDKMDLIKKYINIILFLIIQYMLVLIFIGMNILK